jgi:hypothetical protein
MGHGFRYVTGTGHLQNEIDKNTFTNATFNVDLTIGGLTVGESDVWSTDDTFNTRFTVNGSEVFDDSETWQTVVGMVETQTGWTLNEKHWTLTEDEMRKKITARYSDHAWFLENSEP